MASVGQQENVNLVLATRARSSYHDGMIGIRKYRDRAGLSQAKLADLAGTSQPQIKRLESGERKLTKEWAQRLAPHLGVSPERLLFPDKRIKIASEEFIEDNPQFLKSHVNEDDIFDSIDSPASIPEIDVRAGGAYAGGVGQEENITDASGHQISRDTVRTRWGIPVPFLREELRANPDRVHIVAVRGDSMTDALSDGDRAVIDLDDTDVSQGGIFALVDDIGSVIIKQVELVRGSETRRIRCTSRNRNYAPFELLLDDPVRIIGRVACRITRL